MFSLKGITLIVTGAGSGMGRELTFQLLKKGASVAACDINETTLEETAALASAGGRIRTYVLNVADTQKASALPALVKKDFGSLHGIINNAGIIQPFVKFSQLAPEAVERVMSINFTGVITLTRAVLQELPADTDTFIVNISSMGGFLPVPGQGIYGASKAAVKLFTEALYGELQGTKTHVSVVFPGAIATNIADSLISIKEEKLKQAESKYRTMAADAAASAIIQGIEQGKPRILVGSDAKLMDKLYRLMPVRAINMMAKRINKMIQ